MSTIQIEVDDEVLAKLERLGPKESPARLELIATAIRKALWELEEQHTARAYADQPDSDDAYFEPAAWEP